MNDGPMTKDAHRWAPLTGALFVAIAVVGFAVAGDAPDANDRTARQIVPSARSPSSERASGSCSPACCCGRASVGFHGSRPMSNRWAGPRRVPTRDALETQVSGGEPLAVAQ
jgi:hypothetical protein